MSLKVIGLISGGKDSLYNLVHCLQNGHEIVALANLYPPLPHQDGVPDVESETTDLNSFMYQTVGHSLIPLYAEALNIPLYRRVISGSATQSGRDYDTSSINNNNPLSQHHDNDAPRQSDETEDMCLLIRDVLIQHLEANAIAAGAILSTYQRTRVESVATRLNLTPLAYLWQYPFLPPPPSRPDSLTSLLDDMATAGCDARIIKIASGGIKENLLFANVADQATRARLVTGLAQFFTEEGQEAALRGAVLGEGGEYETLALDGPAPLWKKRIQLEMVDTYDAEGGTIYAKFGNATVVEKQANDSTTTTTIAIPALLDARFQTVLNEILSSPSSTSTSTDHSTTHQQTNIPPLPLTTSYILTPSTLHITNLTTSSSTPQQTTAQTQLLHILTTTLPTLLTTIIQSHNLPPSILSLTNTTHTTLLLNNSMQHFTPCNEIYATHLWPPGLPLPPSRVTLAAILPTGMEVSLSLTISLPSNNSSGNTMRKGLHVQSHSSWAPANIGPYSQAIDTPLFPPSPSTADTTTDQQQQDSPTRKIDIIHCAGQIPLQPSSMTLSTAPFSEQVVLALQHLWRVGQERGVDCWGGAGVAYLASTTGSGPGPRSAEHDNKSENEHGNADGCRSVDRERVMIAARAWQLAHGVDEQGRHRHDQHDEHDEDRDEDEDEVLDVWDLQRNRHGMAAQRITVGQHLHTLPNNAVFSTSSLRTTANSHVVAPPLIAVEVCALPRNAEVEWWSTGLAGLVSAVRSGQCTVTRRRKRFGEWGVADVLSVEPSMAGNGDGDEDRDAAMGMDSTVKGTREYACFVTLAIQVQEQDDRMVSDGARYPGSVEDVKALIFDGMDERAEAFTGVEIVTAQSFVHVSSARAGRLSQDGLVRNSTVVPCQHVWTSLLGEGEQVCMSEVTAVVLLRVNARSI